MVGRFKDAIINDICGERISDNIYLDGNGQLICSNCVLARTGTYDYRESELIAGGSDEKVVKVYRDESEVFDTVSMKSMNFKPLVNDHPDENVTPDTVRDLQKGFMTNVRKGDGEFEGCLIGDLVVTDPEVIDLILNNQKRDLSVGYTADIDEENGRYVMKNIRGNHIALCAAGRAGNARIRDSKTVSDSLESDVLEAIKRASAKGGNGAWATSATISEELNKMGHHYNPNYYNADLMTVIKSLKRQKKVVEKRYGYALADSEFADFEAKGSFDTIAELRSYYPGASVESRGKEVIVRLQSGTKLLYTYLNGSDGKLLFIRRVMDSIRDGVEVLGDSHKLRVGQRVKYFGTPCVVTSIVPNIGSGEFLVEFGSGGQVCGRHSYDEVVTNINQGKIRLLDSVVFDSEAGEFKFEANDASTGHVGADAVLEWIKGNGGHYLPRRDFEKLFKSLRSRMMVYEADVRSAVIALEKAGWISRDVGGGYIVDSADNYADSFKDNYTDCFTDSKYKSGDKVRSKDGGETEIIEKIIEETTAGHDRSGKKVTKYLMKSGRKYLAEDLEGNAWVKVSDSAGTLKSFRVSVGDRKFDTRAHSAAEAMAKVRAAVKDAMPKNYVMYRPSTGRYLQNGSSILNGQIYEGPCVRSAERFDKFPAEMLVKDLNNLMIKLGHKADWVTKEITEKDLGLSDEVREFTHNRITPNYVGFDSNVTDTQDLDFPSWTKFSNRYEYGNKDGVIERVESTGRKEDSRLPDGYLSYRTTVRMNKDGRRVTAYWHLPIKESDAKKTIGMEITGTPSAYSRSIMEWYPKGSSLSFVNGCEWL